MLPEKCEKAKIELSKAYMIRGDFILHQDNSEKSLKHLIEGFRSLSRFYEYFDRPITISKNGAPDTGNICTFVFQLITKSTIPFSEMEAKLEIWEMLFDGCIAWAEEVYSDFC